MPEKDCREAEARGASIDELEIPLADGCGQPGIISGQTGEAFGTDPFGGDARRLVIPLAGPTGLRGGGTDGDGYGTTENVAHDVL